MSHIALYIRSLHGGGAQRMMLAVAGGLLARGHRVDLVLDRKTGSYVPDIPEGVRAVDLRTRRIWRGVPALLRHRHLSREFRPVLLGRARPSTLGSAGALLRYLGEARPEAMLSMFTWNNFLAIWARRAAGSATRVVVSERNTLTRNLDLDGRPSPRNAHVPRLARDLYPLADAVVVNSKGAGDDLARVAGFERSRIEVVYNGFSPRVLERMRETPDHPWLATGGDGGAPVILGVGRLAPQKDFATLIRAFARVRARRPVRLLILGRGKERDALEALVRELGVRADVDLAGFVENPFAYYSRASLFVLSSAWEGFANVLVEALACGCPVVATDCPNGPAEILVNGVGSLVPVGDADAMAAAIEAVLDAPPRREALEALAAEFSEARMVDAYGRLLLGA